MTNELLVDPSDLVHIDNTETINGLKYFSHDTVVANASQMITNCITKIPQDIKLELNNDGTVTIKSGSKVYLPTSGDGVFTPINITADKPQKQTPWTIGEYFVFYSSDYNGLCFTEPRVTNSGSTAPTPDNGHWWYDTTNNRIKYADNNTWHESNYTLPLGLVYSSDGTKFDYIKQTFNGFGYIGSSIFVLPGVKGLIPNGRNTDGTLKNDILNVPSVFVNSYDTIVDSIRQIAVKNTTFSAPDLTTFKYDAINNINLYNGNYSPNVKAGEFELVSGKITNLNIKTPFHALDYNDKSMISGWSMPSSRYVNLTLLASGSTYTAPANGWLEIRKSGSDQEYIKFTGLIETCASASGSNVISLFIPMKKNDTVKLTYTASGTTHVFRFVYAEGER